MKPYFPPPRARVRYHLTAEPALDSDGPWSPYHPGISMRVLCGEASGPCVALLRYAAGGAMPRHIHLGDEHVFVLEGKSADDNGECGPGDYLFNPAGSSRRVRSREGCLLLIHRLGPVRFLADGEIPGKGSDQFRVRTLLEGPESGNPAWTELRPGVRIRTLYRGGPGEYHAALLHYLPGTRIDRHEHVDMEHIFILAGTQRDEHGSYGTGTYIHNPAGTSHEVRSDHGCLAYAHWHAPVRFSAPAGG